MSEAESDWLLRHRDGIEHGPFRLADLVSAARAGNIASDTVVRHEVHTHGQWVFATRIQPLSNAMSRPSQQSPQQTTQPAPPTTEQQPQAQAKVPVNRKEPPPKAATLAQTVPPVSMRSLRENALPVPKTFFDAVLTLFDFRFQRFITPWIIKIFWALCVAFTILWAGKLAYDMIIQPIAPATDTVSASEKGSWQFEPLGEQSLLESRFVRFTLALFLLGLTLLWIRVLCESAIVFFRVATDIREVKGIMREREKE